MEEFYRDLDWELDRFVEYRLPIQNINSKAVFN